jgi:hypothetical protein
MQSKEYFQGFDYRAQDIIKFILAAGIFTMKQNTTGEIIHFSPPEDLTEDFRKWLIAHQVEDIRAGA